VPARQLPAQVRAKCSHLTLADHSFDIPAPVEMPIGDESMLVSLLSSMESIMERFWTNKEPEAAPPQFIEDGLCEEIFNSEMRRDSQGRFAVPLPFHND